MTTLLSEIKQQREPYGNGLTWPKAEIEYIRQEAKAGSTASQIAHVLGRTRCAVLGKMHRENIAINRYNKHDPRSCKTFKHHTGPLRPKVKQSTTKRRKPKEKPVDYTTQQQRDYDAAALNLTLDELEANQCRWAINDGGPFLFCGHETKPGKPYCEHHWQRTRKRDE